MSETPSVSSRFPTASTNAPSHFLWCGRWIGATRVWVMNEWGWRFRNGRDAADWLLWDD